MSNQNPHLRRRGAIYHYRRRLPAPLKGILNESYFDGSLATTDPVRERVEVVLALYRRLIEPGDIVEVRPLPPLRRPGRKSLAARDLLAGGRLSDLLALWRQLVLTEEGVGKKPMRRRRTR